MSSSRIGVIVSENLENKVEEAVQESGLSKSEIVRRGIVREIKELGEEG